ncbi:MAG: cobyric acid synthase CobQ [Proteobacteria bacterium]|nr:MAG: cobyric acid synthase CobQ [Pseudomonadota bacterium]
MTAAVLMIQGTGSDVGKSTLVAGLCRLARRRGMKVWPFKPQNMSNNAAVAVDGGEIGRAQWLQAVAAGVAPSVHMNPVLLKPESDCAAQIIVQGRVAGRRVAADFMAGRDALLPPVLESFRHGAALADLVMVEGAGSAAEINLRPRDIANMGFARAVGAPVVLVGDIDRGGVIASLVGTHRILASEDRAHVAGFIINKFRGDPALFTDGLDAIVAATGWRSFGVVPWLAAARHLPAEDAVVLEDHPLAERATSLLIVVPLLPHIANFDDLDPLRAEPGVRVVFVPPGAPLPREADLIILPGSKATRADLDALRAYGWDIDIKAHVRHGGRVLGLCGGYQMLGRTVSDPHGVEGAAGTSEGLALLEVSTVLRSDKTVRAVRGVIGDGNVPFNGYEIHAGETTGPATARPFAQVAGRPAGAQSADGLVAGLYVHGLFAADGLRRWFLAGLGHQARQTLSYNARLEQALEELADGLESALDVDGLFALAQKPAGRSVLDRVLPT